MVPEEPAFVLLNFGRSDTAESIGGGLDDTAKALRSIHGEVPMIVVLQAPGYADVDSDVREAARAWAEDNGAGVADVTQAFDPPEWPLIGDDNLLTAEGHRLWAETVDEALTG